MIIRVEQQDFQESKESRNREEDNPVVRAVRRATCKSAGLKDYDWIIGHMPVFDEESHRIGQRMPQLYVLSQRDPLATDFYVLPPLAQAFLHQWMAGDSVSPIEFELPLQLTEDSAPGQVFGLPQSMMEGLKTNLTRLSQEANREIDMETLKRGMVKLVQEGNRDVDLNTIKNTVAKLLEDGNKEIDLQTVKQGMAKINAYSQMPVSSIGRQIGRLLVTPIGVASREPRKKEL